MLLGSVCSQLNLYFDQPNKESISVTLTIHYFIIFNFKQIYLNVELLNVNAQKLINELK